MDSYSSNPRFFSQMCIIIGVIIINPNPDLDLSTPYHIISIGYPKIIPYTKFENFGIIRL